MKKLLIAGSFFYVKSKGSGLIPDSSILIPNYSEGIEIWIIELI